MLSKALTGVWTTDRAATNQMTIPFNKLPWKDLSKESKSVESSTTTTEQGQWNWKDTLDDMSPPNFCQYRKENRNINHNKYTCKLCGTECITKNYFDAHMAEVHCCYGRKNKCLLCCVSFTKRSSLNAHIGSSHPKGHLISKCPFGVFKSPKKPMKFFPGFLP